MATYEIKNGRLVPSGNTLPGKPSGSVSLYTRPVYGLDVERYNAYVAEQQKRFEIQAIELQKRKEAEAAARQAKFTKTETILRKVESPSLNLKGRREKIVSRDISGIGASYQKEYESLKSKYATDVEAAKSGFQKVTGYETYYGVSGRPVEKVDTSKVDTTTAQQIKQFTAPTSVSSKQFEADISKYAPVTERSVSLQQAINQGQQITFTGTKPTSVESTLLESKGYIRGTTSTGEVTYIPTSGEKVSKVVDVAKLQRLRESLIEGPVSKPLVDVPQKGMFGEYKPVIESDKLVVTSKEKKDFVSKKTPLDYLTLGVVGVGEGIYETAVLGPYNLGVEASKEALLETGGKKDLSYYGKVLIKGVSKSAVGLVTAPIVMLSRPTETVEGLKTAFREKPGQLVGSTATQILAFKGAGTLIKGGISRVILGKPISTTKFKMTEPGRGTFESYLAQDIKVIEKFKSGEYIPESKQLSVADYSKATSFIRGTTEKGLPRRVYTIRTPTGKFTQKQFFTVKEPLIITTTPSQLAGPEIIKLGGKLQEVTQVSPTKIPRTKGLIGEARFDIKKMGGATPAREFAGGTEKGFFQAPQSKFYGYRQAYGYYAGLGEKSSYEGIKLSLTEPKPSIQITKVKIEKTPSFLVKSPVTSFERAETLAKLTSEKQLGLLKKYSLEQLAKYKRLATESKRITPGTTQIGAAPLTGIRGEFEVTTTIGSRLQRIGASGFRKLFNIGDVRVSAGGKILDLYFEEKGLVKVPLVESKVSKGTIQKEVFKGVVDRGSARISRTVSVSSVKSIFPSFLSFVGKGVSSSVSGKKVSSSVSLVSPNVSLNRLSLGGRSVSSASISSQYPSVVSSKMDSSVVSSSIAPSSVSLASSVSSVGKSVGSVSSSLASIVSKVSRSGSSLSSVVSRVSGVSRSGSLSSVSRSVSIGRSEVSSTSRVSLGKSFTSVRKSTIPSVSTKRVSSNAPKLKETSYVYPSFKPKSLSYKQASFPRNGSRLSVDRINLLKRKESYVVPQKSFSEKNLYRDGFRFNDIKFMKNRVNQWGVSSKNDFFISNKFVKRDAYSSGFKNFKKTFSGLSEQKNRYVFKENYSYKNKDYSYVTNYVDIDVFNKKTIL